MVGLLIGVGGATAEPLLVYLAIPAVVAGISDGRLATANTWLATVVAAAAAEFAGSPSDDVPRHVGSAWLWLAIGLGAGLLAAHQARSLRRLEAAQAPYAAAHRLVGQLHTLVRELPVVLDVSSQAKAIQDAVVDSCPRTGRWCSSVAMVGSRPMSATGTQVPGDEEAGRLSACLRPAPASVGDAVALPAAGRGITSSAPSCSVAGLLRPRAQFEPCRTSSTSTPSAWRRRCWSRTSASSPPRRSGTGWPATSTTASPNGSCLSATSRTRWPPWRRTPTPVRGAEELRAEITRLVSELRFSVFDLRDEVDEAR